MSEGGQVVGEKTVTSNLKVKFFDLHIRSLTVAGAYRQGAHPGIDGLIFFNESATGARKGTGWHPGPRGHVPSSL